MLLKLIKLPCAGIVISCVSLVSGGGLFVAGLPEMRGTSEPTMPFLGIGIVLIVLGVLSILQTVDQYRRVSLSSLKSLSEARASFTRLRQRFATLSESTTTDIDP